LTSFHLINRGDVKRALEHAFAGERAAETSGDPRLRAMARYGPFYAWFHTGPVDRARERADEVVAFARAHGDLAAPFGGEDLLALMVGFQALLEVQSGSVARAREILGEAQQLARERGLVESEGWTTMFVGWNEWIDGDAERALSYCRRALELAERIGSPFSIAWGLGSLAQALAHAGSSEALEVAERGVALCRERGTVREGEGRLLATLAEACVVTGDLPRALRTAEEAVEVARRRGTRRCEIDARLALARALRAHGDATSRARAREALAQVDALADATRAPNWRHVAEFERAGLASTAGDAAARERHLSQALAGFESIDAEYRVRQIRALLSASA
jgi:tetratricopeptide (TPR) repeat protein